MVAYGRLTLHPERSQVQIMVDRLEPLGAGALALAFEQLKKKLTQEGLFKPEHKKPIPDFPQRIGIVTSPQGAALRDLLRVYSKSGGRGFTSFCRPHAFKGRAPPKKSHAP